MSELQPEIQEREQGQIKKLRPASRKIKQFLAREEKRVGASGTEATAAATRVEDRAGDANARP